MNESKQTVYLGKNSIHKLGDIYSELLPSKIFLLRGKESYKISGAKEQFEKLIPSSVQVFEFYNFRENPKFQDVIKGVNLLEEFTPDLIIAIGGGSVLDMAKLVRFCYSYEGDPTGSVFHKKRELVPLVTIPTTAGTGCEATKFSVIYKEGVKYSLEHRDILSDYAIVYSPFTYGNNRYLTACTGFDALAQAIEAYWNVNSTEESDAYALKAINLLWKDLPIVVNTPTVEARDRVSEGAYWAGRAINITKTTAPHALSYPFTTYYGYPHGHAVALSFPFFLKYNVIGDNCNKASENLKHSRKMEWLYKFMGTSYQDVYKSFVEYLRMIGLNIEMERPINIDVIRSNVNLNRLSNNPRIFTKEDMDIFLETICNGNK